MRIRVLFIAIVIMLISGQLKAQKIEILQQGTRTSIRGLSVVDDNVAWISGSRGNVALSTDAGKTWKWQQVKGYEQSDFRDIEAFSAKEAIIMSSGTPAVILKTTDGGETWQLKYKNDDKAYFLDAMDFDGKKHGFILGDPINNKFLLLETKDGGETWNLFSNPPPAMTDEAAFAASGTCLRMNGKDINIVTGGSVSHFFSINSEMKKANGNWLTIDLPVAHGIASKGAFSISNGPRIVVGGNYSKDKNTDSVACKFNANLKTTFDLIAKGPAGYQSCVEYIKPGTYLSTGTSGSNISIDGGQTWTKIDNVSYNVCRKAKKGNTVLLAGDGGKIAILKL